MFFFCYCWWGTSIAFFKMDLAEFTHIHTWSNGVDFNFVLSNRWYSGCLCVKWPHVPLASPLLLQRPTLTVKIYGRIVSKVIFHIRTRKFRWGMGANYLQWLLLLRVQKKTNRQLRFGINTPHTHREKNATAKS